MNTLNRSHLQQNPEKKGDAADSRAQHPPTHACAIDRWSQTERMRLNPTIVKWVPTLTSQPSGPITIPTGSISRRRPPTPHLQTSKPVGKNKKAWVDQRFSNLLHSKIHSRQEEKEENIGKKNLQANKQTETNKISGHGQWIWQRRNLIRMRKC